MRLSIGEQVSFLHTMVCLAEIDEFSVRASFLELRQVGVLSNSDSMERLLSFRRVLGTRRERVSGYRARGRTGSRKDHRKCTAIRGILRKDRVQ